MSYLNWGSYFMAAAGAIPTANEICHEYKLRCGFLVFFELQLGFWE